MERIAHLLGALPPAPDAWVAAAAAIPTMRRALADIDQVVREHPERLAVTAELERALAAAGYEPSPELVDAIRRELSRGD